MIVDRVVLVGFMGAGKTTVGRSLARRLGWRFVDVDTVVAERAGRAIDEIFRTHGEGVFRLLEAEAATDALGEAHVVVATGGGWAAQEGALESLPSGCVSVWLEVGASEAVRRAEGDASVRPLLAVEDPLENASRLLSGRRLFYRRADVRVDTEGRSVDDVTTRILEILQEFETETGAE